MKRLVASILLASMVACTTLRPVADYQQYVRSSQPTQLWVTPRDSKPVMLDGPRFVNDTLVGFVRGQYREFAPGDVTAVQVRLSNQKSEWQRDYEALREATRKVGVTAAE